MRFTKRILATVIAAAIFATSIPAIQSHAASLKYSDTYVKTIKMEKPVVADTSSAGSSASSATDISSTAASDTASTAATTPETVQKVEDPGETVKVMSGMKFVISTTLYGKLIKTSRNKVLFKFASSNSKIAKVSNKGVVTTLKNGKCDITVTNKKDKVKYVIHLVVTKNVKIKKIKLDTTSKKFKKLNKTFTLKAKITASTKNVGNIPYYWYSTDEDVASVDQFGNVSVEGYGECEICCIAGSNGKVGKCKVSVVNPKAKENTEQAGVTENRPAYKTGKVVDISSHNVVTDWSKLKASCDAVIIRMGYRGYGSGTLVQDTSFASNVYNCQQYGIPYSVYFFTTAVSESEGVEEGNWIADRIGGQTLCFPVFIDSEYRNTSHSGRSDSLSASTRTAAVKGACSQLNDRGVSSGVYASTSWLYNNLNMSDLPYYVWVAHYSSACGYGGSKLLWQFTSTGSGYGVRTGGSDRCDVSYWYQ